MMRDQRLLQRINNNCDPQGEAAHGRASRSDQGVLIRSITEHLIRILNTRQGSVAIDPHYGIPDFSYLPGNFMPPEAHDIEKEIVRTVMRYEPRIKRVDVVFNGVQPGEDQMSFTLKAVVVSDGMELDMNLNTGVGADGLVKLSA